MNASRGGAALSAIIFDWIVRTTVDAEIDDFNAVLLTLHDGQSSG